MAEEAVVTPPAEQQSQMGVSGHSEDIMSTLNALKGMPGMQGNEAAIELERTLTNPVEQKNPASETDQTAEGQETSGAENTSETGAPAATTAETSMEVDSPIFGGKKTLDGKDKTASIETKGFSTEADLAGYVKKEFGQEVTGLKDMDKFLGSAKKWRTDSQKLPELDKRVKDLENAIVKLPEPLYEAVKAYWTAQDWQKAIDARPRIDFNKNTADHDAKALIENYFPGQFTKEDFGEGATPEQKRATQVAEQSAKKLYEADKTAFEQRRTNIMNEAREKQNLFKSSVSSSVSALKETFPDLQDDTLKEVSSILEGGAQKILSEFFNADGYIKQNAAEMLVMARHAKGLIDQLTRFAANRASTKATEEILARTPSAPGENKPGGSDNVTVSPEVAAYIEQLTGTFTKKKTY